MDDDRTSERKPRSRSRVLLAIAIIAATTVALITAIGSRDRRASTPVLESFENNAFSREALTVAQNIRFEGSGPPLTVEDITAFEKEIGGHLPDDYKQFLLAHNGGFCEPELGLPWAGDVHTLLGFLALLPDNKYAGIRDRLRHLDILAPKEARYYLPIADTTSECAICLAYRGENAGKVFFTAYKYRIADNHDMIPVDVTMVPVADSFTELLNYLVEIAKTFCRIEDLGKRGTEDDLARYLAEGNSIDTVGKNEQTILCEAVKVGNAPMVQACIKRGATLSQAVHFAVRNLQTELIEVLIHAGADINETDEFGHTPLYYAVGTSLPGDEGVQRRKMHDLLVKLGAVDAYRRVEDLGERGTEDDLTRYLGEGHSIDAVGKVFDSTIILEAIRANNRPMIEACIKHGARLSGTIEVAVQNQQIEIIEMLAAAGADVNEPNEYGHRPLSYVPSTAVPGKQGARNKQILDLLIRLGAVE